jgi:hypothetical protein
MLTCIPQNTWRQYHAGLDVPAGAVAACGLRRGQHGRIWGPATGQGPGVLRLQRAGTALRLLGAEFPPQPG